MIKKSFLILPALLLCLGMAGCKEKDKEETINQKEQGGEVPFAPCPCEKPLAGWSSPPETALLFKDAVPEEQELQMRNQAYRGETVSWIVFDSKQDISYLNVMIYQSELICKICNFPTVVVKEWNIPQNGCNVYFEGITYQACEPLGGIGTVSYFDYVLTKLKIK
jgi:hypothetical protein